jgi:hypothetical protein
MFMKISASGVDLRVLAWIREFILGHIERAGGQLSEKVRVTAEVPQGSVLGLLLFLGVRK